MILHLDLLGGAGAVLAVAAAASRTSRELGQARLLSAAVGLGAVVAVAAADATVAAVGFLIAGLAARVASSEGTAPVAAWAFLGDAVVAAGLGAAALDVGDPTLPWVEGGAAPGWAVVVVAVGALIRLTATGMMRSPLVVAAAIIGVRLAGLPAAGEPTTWLVLAVGLAVVFAWVGRPTAALAGLGWAGLGVADGAGAAAFLLAGAAVVAVTDVVSADHRVEGLGRLWARLRSATPTPPRSMAGLLAALAAIPAGVGLVRVPYDESPEAVLLLLGLVVTLALVARAPLSDERVGALDGAVAALLVVPLLAPGWWADRLEITDVARGVTDALTSTRTGTVAVAVALVVGGAATWAASRRTASR